MDNKTVLIVGITGFLGRHLAKYLIDNYSSVTVIGIANSQYKISQFMKVVKNVKVHCLNITSKYFDKEIDTIFRENNIDYVVHTAAMKYIEIAEDNVMTTIHTNVIATDTLIKAAKRYNVANLVAISTDKANSPKNVYGMSKYMMEKLVTDNRYTIYQGVNFLWSDGSVFDIWYKQMIKGKELTVTNLNFVRYFDEVKNICKDIIDNIDKKGVILPRKAYTLSVKQCLECFMKYYSYDKYIITGERDIEKRIEEINSSIETIELTDAEFIKVLDYSHNNLWMY